jgi:hypothetical protein
VQKVYEGHYTLRADRYEWPFEFRFPLSSQAGINDDAFKSSPPFCGNEDAHPLPPTFYHSGHGFATNFDAFTEYKLEVALTRPPQSYKIYAAPIEQVYSITYSPTHSGPPRDFQIKLHQQHLTAKTLRLLPEKSDAKLTMKEKMRSTFKKSDLPSVSFTVMLAYPTQIWPDGELPLKLCVRYGTQSEDVLDRPPIYLKNLNAEVKTYIKARCTGIFGGHHDNDTSRKPILHRPGLHVVLPGIEEAENGDEPTEQWYSISGTTSDEVFVPPTLPIDFSTYNIATHSRIEVKFRLTCADKDFNISAAAPLRVLPPVSGFVGVPLLPALVAGPSRVADTTRLDVTDVGPSDPLPPPPYIPAPTYDSLESGTPETREQIGPVG